jgi:hypothetical protein
MKKGMRTVLEEVISNVLRMLPPEVPEFKKVTGFSADYTISKTNRSVNGLKARRVHEMERKPHRD